MNGVAQHLDSLRTAASKIPLIPSPYQLVAPTFGPGCCEGELEELQEAFRGQLPADYLDYLSLCRRISAEDVYNGYFLYSPIALSAPSPGWGAPSRLYIGSEPNLVDVSVFSVGGDGSGNQFVLSTSPEAHGHVWKWNHELPVRFDGVAREGLTLLGESFTGFLQRMADDWVHFAAGDRDWPYFSG